MSDSFEERGKAMEDGYFRQRENELIAKMREKLAANATAATHDCPKCDGKLVEGDFEAIKIDACDKCGGVWLDAGELQQIVGKDAEKQSGWFARLLS